MAQFGIQGCLATQEAEEEAPEQEVVMPDDEVAVLKAQLAALQQQMTAKLEAAEKKIEANAERIAKNTEIATIANTRSLVNRDLLKTSPVKTEEPPAPTPDATQTPKRKVSAPVPGFVVDLTLISCPAAWKTAQKSPT